MVTTRPKNPLRIPLHFDHRGDTVYFRCIKCEKECAAIEVKSRVSAKLVEEKESLMDFLIGHSECKPGLTVFTKSEGRPTPEAEAELRK